VTPRKSQAELPSINLKSSATLGTGRTSSHREIVDRLEDREVRRVSKRTKLDPMIDEDSGDEDYNSPPADVTNPPRASPEQTRQLRTPDINPAVEDPEALATKELPASVTAVPTSAGSALRRYADGSVAAPKMLPKRNKGSKVNGFYPT